MIAARRLKTYLTPDGMAHFVDPDPRHVGLIRQLHPSFQMRKACPPYDFVPNLAKTRGIRTVLKPEELTDANDDLLWRVHIDAVAGRVQLASQNSASLLDIKIELARRELLDCRLCGCMCGVNRFLQVGRCGLRDKSYVAETFLHIAEEAVITPAATVKLYQCALNCAGCQSWELIHKKERAIEQDGRVLDGKIWASCPDFEKATAIEFVGGNPDESVHSVLKALSGLPSPLVGKPLVWNTHGYAAPIVYDLLNRIVDVYIPDFKGSDPCVEAVSRVKDYWRHVTVGINRMVCQNARVIVRILVLPGHLECCHKPSLRWLAQFRDRIWISLLQFIPDYQALKDIHLNRSTNESEMVQTRKLVRQLGLRDVDENPEEFWGAK